jgi:putative ABC transport system permease protein
MLRRLLRYARNDTGARVHTLFLIVRRSLRQHFLSTCVTAFSVALACGLLMSVFAIQTQTYEAMTAGATRFDAVLGARGSQLQLVLNAVFHLDVSPGNIPYRLYTTMKNDPRVAKAIPYVVGDNYHGFRIVGTTPELFTYKAAGRDFELEQGGRFFAPQQREAVVGSFAAAKAGLKIGSVFNAYHGIVFNEKMKHDEQFTVVGILKPTNTPADRAIWTPLESFYRLSGHMLRGTDVNYVAQEGQEIPEEHKEVSAVMVKFKSPQTGMAFDQTINRQGKVATLAWPIEKVMADFLNKIGWFHKILSVLAYVIALTAAGAILAGIYNSMNERRREFAILRALGARRTALFAVIVLESAAIAAIGTAVGFVIYAIVLSTASLIIRTGTGVVIEVFRFHPVFVWAPMGIILLGTLAGIIPAIKAYQNDVAENLAPVS